MRPKSRKFKRRGRKVTAMEANILPSDDSMQAVTAHALFDSGCSSSMLHASKIPKRFWERLKKPVTFSTKNGDFKVRYTATVEVLLPELSLSKTFTWSFYLDQSKDKCRYDLFIGSDIMETLGIDLNFSTTTIQWDDSFAPM